MGSAISALVKPINFIIDTIKEIIELFLAAFNLGKDLVLGGIAFTKTVIETLLNFADLINSFLELLQFGAKLITKYLHIPFVFVYLTPFLVLSYYFLNFLDIII